MSIGYRASLLLAAGILAGWLAMLPAPVGAQERNVPIRFAVVDVEQVEREAAMNKDMTAQMNDLRKKLSEQVKQEEAELRKASEELQRQKVLLSPDAFEQEVRKFRQKEIEFQKKIQARNNDFNRVRVYARNAFGQELTKALTEITKEHELTLVFRRSQLLVSATALDITHLVLAQINKNVPKFTFPKDVLQPAASAPKAAAPKAADKKGSAPAKK